MVNRPTQESKAGGATEENKPKTRTMGSFEIAEYSREATLLSEEQVWLDELVELLKIGSVSSEGYYRLRDAVGLSRFHDVKSLLHRALMIDSNQVPGGRIGDLYHMIVKRGYKSDAASWLQAATPEGMEQGGQSFTKERRLEEAEASAQKAGVPLLTIAEEYGLQEVLNA